MNHRMAMLVMIVLAAGCRSGAATIPPPATGAYQQPNQYYQQPSATPTFTPPTYGAPATGAAAKPPSLSQTNPSFAPRPNVSLAANSNDGLAWKSVTTQPSIAANNTAAPGAINPRTTLTTIRGTNNPVAGAPGGLRSINELPMVGVPGAPQYNTAALPTTTPLRSMAPPPTSPIATPMFSSPAPFTPAATGPGRYSADPWRGR